MLLLWLFFCFVIGFRCCLFCCLFCEFLFLVLCFCLLLLLLSLFVSSRVFFMCLSSCAECRTMKSDVANTHTSACVVSRQSVLNENPARFAIFALHENNYLCYSYASTEPQKFGSFFLLMSSFIKKDCFVVCFCGGAKVVQQSYRQEVCEEMMGAHKKHES